MGSKERSRIIQVETGGGSPRSDYSSFDVILLFFFFFAIYTLTMSGRLQYGGETEKYRVAQSIVDKQSLAIRPIATRNESGVGGQSYSIYEMGQTLFEIPLYALGRLAYAYFPVPDVNWITMLIVGLLNPILTALTCVVLYRICLGFGFRRATTLGIVFLFGVGSIAWPYTRALDREPLLALLILVSFYACYLFRNAIGTRNANRWLIVIGALAGYLVFTKFIQAMVVPLLLLYLGVVIYQQARQTGLSKLQGIWAVVKGGIFFSLPLLLFVALQVAYALARFGTLYGGIGGTKYNLVQVIWNELVISTPLTALAGFAFSLDESMFIYSPPLILFLVTWYRWFQAQKKEALLLLGIVVIEVLSAVSRWEWWGGPRWGPRYLVQIVPLMLIPIGGLESFPAPARRFWTVVAGIVLVLGMGVQLTGVLTNERNYFDAMARDPNLFGQLDSLRHGALDSLFFNLSPAGSLVLNPFGIFLTIVAAILLVLLLRPRMLGNLRAAPMSGLAFSVALLLLESVAFIVFVLAPYPQVMTSRGNTKFTAASWLMADNRPEAANILFLDALDLGTDYEQDAVSRLSEISPHGQGTSFDASDLVANAEVSENGSVTADVDTALSGTSVRASAPPAQDANARGVSGSISVSPNTNYELSGWMKAENIYGTGAGSVTVYEDDGAWNHRRTTGIGNLDETTGWRPFRGSFTTLPTTQRVFVAAGLWETYGTLWVDKIMLAEVSH